MPSEANKGWMIGLRKLVEERKFFTPICSVVSYWASFMSPVAIEPTRHMIKVRMKS